VGVRSGNIGADAQVIFIKDHAEAIVEGDVDFLPRPGASARRLNPFAVHG
jgi:hypothetical protein